jgi:nitric oxide reductase subunit B
MRSIRTYWVILGTVVAAAFLVLGFAGREIYRQAPPVPEKVVAADGTVLWTGEQILDGQQVWQSAGGQQIGSIWGHGAYQAPDWSADWLHRESTTLLDAWSRREHGVAYDALDAEKAAALRERLKREMRGGGYDAATKTITLSADRTTAVAATAAHYDALFGSDPSLAKLRDAYALHDSAVPDATRRRTMMGFFFWTAWACAAERPGTGASWTNNWPHEPLIGNVPTTANVMWSIVSIVVLLAGIGVLLWWHARRPEEPLPAAPATDPLDAIRVTPSMKAVAKYGLVVTALFAVQAILGALTAHYTVEGRAFFGFPLADYLPYAVTRTWHIQLAVFWIATAFLAAGLFLAPAVGGREPKGQRLGVNVLLGALFLVVGGSLAGEWFSIRQKMSPTASFWFGHQGYEYVDLGRGWQIALFGGLLLWLWLTVRAIRPALSEGSPARRSVVALFAASAGAIGLFYAAGFLYGARTHLSVMEFWRWWVVHLWVEGFMEVFATAALAFLFSRMGLVRSSSAARASILSTAIFLVAGIPGTLHHLYFSGTPVSAMAVGAAFSALEVVPLVLLGAEAVHTMRMGDRAPWMSKYRWPLRFFAGTAVWNLVGAGLFGFLINPPISLYYVQGLNTTPVHGHTALFGVYGLLALGLVLLVLRRTQGDAPWRDRPIRLAFWCLNIGLALMVVLSLLPIGLMQASASIEHGLWYARSAEFLQQPVITALRWARFAGDSVFLVGVASFAWFVVGLFTGRSFDRRPAAGTDRVEPFAAPPAAEPRVPVGAID